MFTHVDPIGKPEDNDTKANSRADNGKEAEGEDANEFEATAFVHRSKIKEEYDWYGPGF
jgi:hypothetical protein